MNFNNIKIYFNQRYDCRSIELWVIEMSDTRQFNISINSDNLLERFEIDEMQAMDSSVLKPFLKLPMTFANSLFKSIAEYNSANGLKTKDENLIEGKLQATEVHLKDMREIAMKLLENIR